MKAIASVVIASFGFFEGVNILLHYITGFLSDADFPLYFGMVLDHGVYWGFLFTGILAYKNKNYAKHFALVLVSYWAYMHFNQLTWPLNKPGFFGNTGWLAWKRTIDIVSVGVAYSIALYAAVFILYSENLTRRSSKDAENGAA